MTSLLRFNRNYFLLTVLLLAIEIVIALFVHDQVIRPYIGDLLVVMLVYCFVKSFLEVPVVPTALAVLIFSFVVETLQYFKIIQSLGLQDSSIAKTIIGTSFAWTDIIAYISGILLVLIIEHRKAKRKNCQRP